MRIIKIAEVKRALQMHRKANEAMLAITRFGSFTENNIHIGDDELIKVAKLFNLKIQKTNTDGDSWHGSIYLEGYALFSFKFNFDRDISYKYKQTKKEFKQAFFEADGDRQKAFEIMKNKDKYYLTNYKTLSDLEKFWRRSEENIPMDAIMQKYHAYRGQWVEGNRDDDGYRADDYRSPLTFKAWYCKNV